MRPHLLFVVASLVACAKPQSTAPPETHPVVEDAESSPTAAQRPSGRPEVRKGPPGGGEGWISSANVSELEDVIAYVRGAPEEKRFWMAVTGLARDDGRIPAGLRGHLDALAGGGDFDHIGAALVENADLVDAACGRDLDPLMEKNSSEGVTYEQLAATLYDQCDLGRFGVVERGSLTSDDPFITLFAFAILLHLDGIGGPHPAEEALIKVIVGVPANEALGEGDVIRERDVAMPAKGWVEIVAQGYRARWPRPPIEKTKPDVAMGKPQIIDAVDHDDCFYQVAQHQLSRDDIDLHSAPFRMLASAVQPGEVLSEEDTTIGGLPALARLSEVAEPTPARVETRTVIKGKRFYSLFCLYPIGRKSPCGQFFDSFAWTAG